MRTFDRSVRMYRRWGGQKQKFWGVKWRNWKKRGTYLMPYRNTGKPANTGVLRCAEINPKIRGKSSL